MKLGEMVGFDTGFFYKLLEAKEEQVELWTNLHDDEKIAIVSCLTLFELERLALKTQIEKEAFEVLSKAIPDVCKVVWLNNSILSQAAKISHGTGIPSVDALILTSLLSNGATTIYTTDNHLKAYKQKGIKVIVID